MLATVVHSTVWLTRPLVLAIHDEQLAEHGGASGLRDGGLLDSAIARPRNHAVYTEAEISELAAITAMALAQNHPFIDGNKRTAFVALEYFLIANRHMLTASDAESVVVMQALAAGELADDEFLAWVRLNSLLRA
jgi:death-on-curing protein